MTKKFQTSSLPNLIFLVLLFCLCLSWVWRLNGAGQELTYSQVRQLFVQERVSAFTVSDNTLTMKLNQPMADGRDTVRYELDDVQWFKEDLGELVVQQAQKGIITAYDYQASSTSVWLWARMASLLVGLASFTTPTSVTVRPVAAANWVAVMRIFSTWGCRLPCAS